MGWKKIPAEEKQKLAERLRVALAGRTGLSEKQMFGGTCFLLHNHMLCGTGSGSFLFRVGKEAHAAAVKRPRATPMVHNGRKMEGYIWVEPEVKDLEPWIELAVRHVSSLPPKKVK